MTAMIKVSVNGNYKARLKYKTVTEEPDDGPVNPASE